jgi:formylglycine-generating enzyme required for sulfatase activity
MAFVSWDAAAAYAEKAGKRLPDEWEFEFSATVAGTQRFPWGNDSAKITAWEFGEIGLAEWDVTPADTPLQGLFSNVGEWTSSWPTLYPAHRAAGMPPPENSSQKRVVRGAMQWIVEGRFAAKEFTSADARTRFVLPRSTFSRAIGFRCARSAAPRLQPGDFGRELTP